MRRNICKRIFFLMRIFVRSCLVVECFFRLSLFQVCNLFFNFREAREDKREKGSLVFLVEYNLSDALLGTKVFAGNKSLCCRVKKENNLKKYKQTYRTLLKTETCNF